MAGDCWYCGIVEYGILCVSDIAENLIIVLLTVACAVTNGCACMLA